MSGNKLHVEECMICQLIFVVVHAACNAWKRENPVKQRVVHNFELACIIDLLNLHMDMKLTSYRMHVCSNLSGVKCTLAGITVLRNYHEVQVNLWKMGFNNKLVFGRTRSLFTFIELFWVNFCIYIIKDSWIQKKRQPDLKEILIHNVLEPQEKFCTLL